MNKSVLGGFVALVLMFGVQNFVFALPCTQGDVSGTTFCQDGTTNNDSLNPLAVNDQWFFGFNDWEYLAKQNTPGAFEGSPDYDWTVTPTTGTRSGDWSFNSSVWTSFTDVMIVVKSGKHKTNNGDIFFSGYLLDSSIMPTSGTWDTGDKDLSHLTLYARGEGTGPPPAPVPEPATMLLFGTGLVGLVSARLRKKK